MKNMFENLFSKTLSVLKKGTVETLCTFLVPLMILLAAGSCEKPKNPNEKNNGIEIEKEDADTNIFLQGTKWKLVGIFDAETDTLIKELEPKDCISCYTLEFRDADIIGFHTSTNKCSGPYEVDYKTGEIRIIELIGTLVGEYPDGDLFFYNIFPEFHKKQSFSSRADKLKWYWYWYYNNREVYLLYKTREL
ncbi:MAG: hypothetical protein FWH36_02665 [Lentimicrobiaceae bacterium]|nr:hypothetical protein [Lentimicrobiaceae bacterium]